MVLFLLVVKLRTAGGQARKLEVSGQVLYTLCMAEQHVPPYLELLNPEQRRAALHTGSPLLILAGAGSGKTRVITAKIAWFVREQGLDPRSILGVSADWQQAIKGFVLLAAVAFDLYSKRRTAK